ncbi:phosphonate metabolism transcriptional regulator PhnF (plasmid) [Tistrella bauzanensis]|uniref:phosphonate metabolism transcriptional regulator PhnF n=1 Tax=Tistrella TaxID=171436 RepID=UPI0031F6EC9E
MYRHDADDTVPRWRQIELSLMREIERRSLKPGERLPSENALSQMFGVNRGTLRRALAELQRKGLIRIEKGRGAFVQEHPVLYEIGRSSRFGTNLLKQNLRPTARIIRAAEIPASIEIAEWLSVDPGVGVVFFETLGFADTVPISLTRHHLPAARLPDAARMVSGFDCISDVYDRFALGEITRRATRITARLPGDDEARHLQQALTQPILIAETVKVDAAGIPVDYTIARFAADRVQLFVGEDMQLI